MLRFKSWALVIAIQTACGPNQGPEQDKAAPPHSATGPRSPVTTAPASASASARPTPPGSKWTGSWSGELDSKKTKVSLDPGVTEKAWTADDGRAASGPGKMSLAIADDGSITGRVEGSLGPGLLTGSVDSNEDVVTATLTPEEPHSESAMSGTLVLTPQSGGKELTGTLRASSGSGEIVREAKVDLKRRLP